MPRSPNGTRKLPVTISLTPVLRDSLPHISTQDGRIESLAECAARLIAEETADKLGGGQGFVEMLLGTRLPSKEFTARVENEVSRMGCISQRFSTR